MTGDHGWPEARPIADLEPIELTGPGSVFEHQGSLYRSTGRRLGYGGMGTCFLVERKDDGGVELCVAKTFHADYLHQLQTDDVTRRDHETALRTMDLIRGIEHDHLLPTYAAEPLAENYLTVTPLMDATLRQTIAVRAMPARQRVELLIQSLHGLARLHEQDIVHRDFTLRNILVQDDHAYLFDFDLCLHLPEVANQTYRSYYRGRVFGSPGYSVPPEVLDAELMDTPVGLGLDIYAAGTALFALFSERLPAGEAEDMWGLLLKVSDGLVIGGRSRINYPAGVPRALRPMIERCMERDPRDRYSSVGALLVELEGALPLLSTHENAQRLSPVTTWTGTDTGMFNPPQGVDLQQVELVDRVNDILVREGYRFWKGLGRVSDHQIFAAVPDPVLVAEGRFPDANIYPKIVTVKELGRGPEADATVEKWFRRYVPLLKRARQGLLTPLYRVCWDEESGLLLLLSEYVEDARFGPALEVVALAREEALALGFLVARQILRIHEVGLAHNNVCAESLMFKALQARLLVLPAMVGLVAPTEDVDAMSDDVQRLCELILSWLKGPLPHDDEMTLHGAESEAISQPIRDLMLQTSPRIQDLLAVLTDGLCAIDDNFRILNEHGGDLDSQALLVSSQSLYVRLWRD